MKKLFYCVGASWLVLFFCIDVSAGLVDNVTSMPNTSAQLGASQLNALKKSGGYYLFGGASEYSECGVDTDEVLDYKDQIVGPLVVQKLPKQMDFKKDLTVDQYNTLVRSWLNSLYNAKFNGKAWAIRYFIRAIAESVYSTDGTLYEAFFNRVLDGFDKYQKIEEVISALKVSDDIKYALTKYYASILIYSRVPDFNEEENIDKIKNIPQDASLFITTSVNNETLGEYNSGSHGANLYYVCLKYYGDSFKNLTIEKQIDLVDAIYTYNPTLMISPHIIRKKYAFDYLLDWFFDMDNPKVMKYCLKGYVNWVILPEKI